MNETNSMKPCEGCKNSETGTQCSVRWVSPVNGKHNLFLSCMSARGSECYCGSKAMYFEAREPELPQQLKKPESEMTEIEKHVVGYLVKEYGWGTHLNEALYNVMQALEGIVELPKELSEEDKRYFWAKGFREAACDDFDGWLKWRREK